MCPVLCVNGCCVYAGAQGHEGPLGWPAPTHLHLARAQGHSRPRGQRRARHFSVQRDLASAAACLQGPAGGRNPRRVHCAIAATERRRNADVEVDMLLLLLRLHAAAQQQVVHKRAMHCSGAQRW